MKKLLIVSALSLITTAAFAFVPNAPKKICLRMASPQNGTTSVELQLSYPGQGGINSGNITSTSAYTCMTPYAWSGGPHNFKPFAMYSSSSFWGLRFAQCDLMETTAGGIAKASHGTEYYTAHPSISQPLGVADMKCTFDHTGP